MAEAGTVPLDRFTSAMLDQRWPVVAVAGLAMLALTAGAVFIGVTNDHRVLFDEHNPQLLAYDALEETYTESDTALIAIAPGTPVFTRETLGLMESLTEAAWQTPHSIRVDSLTNYNHSESVEDDLAVGPLVEGAEDLTDEALARVERIAMDAPEIAGRLVSTDSRVAALAITFALPEDADAAVIEITDYLKEVLDGYRSEHPDVGFHVTGDVLMNRAFADATKDDLEKLTPFAFLVIVLVTIAVLRSALATVAVVAVLMFTINTTLGFAGWVGTVFNPVNAGVPLIVLTIAVADSIHIVSGAMAGLGKGLAKRDAIIESMRENAYPVFLTSVTTAIAFLTLNASEAPPFRVLGNLVAFGVMCAFVYSMTLLPALLAILPLRAGRDGGKWVFLDRLADFVIARRGTLIWVMSLVSVALIAGIWKLEFSDNWTKYFDDRYEFRRDTDFIVENLTGLESWEFSLDSGEEGGITDPDYLRAVDAFALWLRAQPEVSHVQAFPDIMKRLNKNMHGDDPSYHRIPEDGALAAQYLLIYELSLPFGSDLNNRIDIAKSATRLTAMAGGGLTAREQRDFDARAQDWLNDNAPDLVTPATGFTMAFAHLSLRNIESMLQATILAMGGISIILFLVLRSWRLGLISLIPNYVPAAMSFGVWGYLVGQVGLAGSVMTAIAFGIVVDDTTHFLTKYQRVRKLWAVRRPMPYARRSKPREGHFGQRRPFSWPASWCSHRRASRSAGRSAYWSPSPSSSRWSPTSCSYRRCSWPSTGERHDVESAHRLWPDRNPRDFDSTRHRRFGTRRGGAEGSRHRFGGQAEEGRVRELHGKPGHGAAQQAGTREPAGTAGQGDGSRG